MSNLVFAPLNFVILLGFFHFAISVETHLRGVPVSISSLYSVEGKSFTCLDGSKNIAFSQINDDYCDCSDGSDEPGTAACTNGMFHCPNVGHRSRSIPSSRVNDGICDCCDTSDEYIDNSRCSNICAELDQQEQNKRKSMAALYATGAALREQLIEKGKELKTERLTRLIQKRQQKAERELIKVEKENVKKGIEALEADALELYKEQQREEEVALKADEELNANRVEIDQYFLKYDTNKDSFIEVTELQVDISLDKNRDGIVSIEEAKYFLDERDRVDLESFIALSWPRIKPFKMLDQGIFKPPVEAVESEANNHEKASNEENGFSTLTDQSDIEDDKKDFENEEIYDDEEENVGDGSVEEEIISKPEYDPETQRIIEQANEARSAYAVIEREIRDIDNEIKILEEQDLKDYGMNEEFASMDGECYSFEDREYVYKLCPFDRASQQQRGGGSETTLGRWDQWNGSEDDKYSEMKYSHGTSCWNGPQRSAIVQLKCAMENKISSVTEPNRCEYLFVFETPASCKEFSFDTDKRLHDEL